MGTTVSGPSITVDETAETITLSAGATIPSSFLRVFGCETMTVTAEAEATRKIKALDVVPAIGMSGSMRRGAGEDGTGETIRFGDSGRLYTGHARPVEPYRTEITVFRYIVPGFQQRWISARAMSASGPGCVKTIFEARARNIDSRNCRRRQ